MELSVKPTCPISRSTLHSHLAERPPPISACEGCPARLEYTQTSQSSLSCMTQPKLSFLHRSVFVVLCLTIRSAKHHPLFRGEQRTYQTMVRCICSNGVDHRKGEFAFCQIFAVAFVSGILYSCSEHIIDERVKNEPT